VLTLLAKFQRILEALLAGSEALDFVVIIAFAGNSCSGRSGLPRADLGRAAQGDHSFVGRIFSVDNAH
jgi:hypothetical protein